MKQHTQYKTIFFDLGNVLVFFSHSKMIAQIACCSGLCVEKVQDLLIGQQLASRYERGDIDSDELYRVFRAVGSKQFTPRDLYEAASDIFTPNDPMYPLVRSLKEKGLRLVLLSNTSAAHFKYLSSRYRFLDDFDAKILSYEVGACKPNPDIYRAALQAAHCLPQECFYTDDIPEYIEAAKTHGIDAKLFLDVPTLKAELSSRSLL